jgi:hypothetical protein
MNLPVNLQNGMTALSCALDMKDLISKNFCKFSKH